MRLRALPWLFSATALLGAGLLFLVEPLAAKLLLPSFGGAATVWATCTLFFQLALLGAYALVHLTSKLGFRRQVIIHGVIMLAAVGTLPITLGDGLETTNPIVGVMKAMAVMVGLPFAVLATTGPLIQRWYAWAGGPRAHDPYFIYAASNAGSFIGLLAYPFLVEPNFPLATQRVAWSWAFGVFLFALGICALATLKVAPREGLRAAKRDPIPLKTYGKWLLLAFIPSSLMLGVTSHITIDVAPIPLLWVIPLAIYLATMVLAFGRSSRSVPKGMVELAVAASILAVAMAMRPASTPLELALLSSLLAYGLVAYAAHVLLAVGRPGPEALTAYYLTLAAGGALGGVLNGLVAPSLFSWASEFFIVFAAAPLLLLFKARPDRKVTMALGTAFIMLATPLLQHSEQVKNLPAVGRTFYSTYAVKDEGPLRTLLHGTTVHGAQDRSKPRTPLTYYGQDGPIGDLFRTGHKNVTVVGLGTGALAAYSRPGEAWNFLEIDKEMVKLAREQFTYLGDSPAKISVGVGDGRRLMEAVPDGSQDLIILDAFSSDSIPVHLLTREAALGYAEKLSPEGILVFHVSNRVFDLVPVAGNNARALGWYASYGFFEGDSDTTVPSEWVAMSRSGATARTLEAGPNWRPLNMDAVPAEDAWTDDYSSVFRALAPGAFSFSFPL